MKHLILLCLSVFCLTIMPYTSNSNSVTAPTSISTVDNTPPPVDRNPRKKVKKKKKRKNLNRKNKKNAFRKFFNSSDKTPKQKGTLYIGLAAMFLALGITAMCIIALNSDIGARLMLGIAIVLLAIPFIIFLVLGIKQLKIATLFFKPTVYRKELPIDYIGKNIEDQ